MKKFLERFRNQLEMPVDGASLAFFRIVFGLAIAFDAWHALHKNEWGVNSLDLLYGEAKFNFSYPGFEWVAMLPEPWLTAQFVIMGVAGLLMAVGLFYRISASVVAILFSWYFLSEAAIYLNHFYLISLLAFLMIGMPADRCFSIDAWRSRNRQSVNSHYLPFWPVFLIRAQMFIVYIYAGIAKLEYDWLAGHTIMLRAQVVAEKLEAYLGSGWAPEAATLSLWMSWGGVVFDLLIGFLLIGTRTRYLGLAFAFGFHASNHFMFNIGVFPFLGMAATLMFCAPDWPRRLLNSIRNRKWKKPDWRWLALGALIVPGVGALLGWKAARMKPLTLRSGQSTRIPNWLFGLIIVFVTFQTLAPLKHFTIPGNASWTDEGHWFSWRMMLRRKSGNVQFEVVDPKLIVTDRYGDSKVDWNQWPDSLARKIYQKIDSREIAWDDMPELMLIYEPVIGERIIWNPRQDKLQNEIENRIGELWQTEYSREPGIHRTQSFPEALEAAWNHANHEKPESEDRRMFLAKIEMALNFAVEIETLPPGSKGSERLLLELSELLEDLTFDQRHGSMIHRELARIQPFSLQGGSWDAHSCYVIEDEALFSSSKFRYRSVREWKLSDRVFVDLSRMRHVAWKHLPNCLVCPRGSTVHIEWNPHSELIEKQMASMGRRSFLSQRYARHIANRWQQLFGRRPQIFAKHIASMNHHAPQYLIDPGVDLASVSPHAFRHNEWILQLKRSDNRSVSVFPSEAGRNLDLTDHIPELQLQDRPLVRTIEKWYPDGTLRESSESFEHDGDKLTTVSSWYETGERRLRASYKNGVLHGIMNRWYKDGKQAAVVTYHEGTRNGPAILWNEDGSIQWQGEIQPTP